MKKTTLILLLTLLNFNSFAFIKTIKKNTVVCDHEKNYRDFQKFTKSKNITLMMKIIKDRKCGPLDSAMEGNREVNVIVLRKKDDLSIFKWDGDIFYTGADVYE